MSRLSSSTSSLQQRIRRARKTHEELYDEVITLGNANLRIDTTSIGQKLPARTDRSPPDSRTAALFEASLAVKPSEIRRAGSLNRGTPPAASQPLRRFASTSDRTTSSHIRQNSTTRSPLATAEPITELPGSEESSPVRKRPARRDSIVLEKARHWGAPG